eukprot:jgi/Botrbrau1/12052/Bobra.0295s0007.1
MNYVKLHESLALGEISRALRAQSDEAGAVATPKPEKRRTDIEPSLKVKKSRTHAEFQRSRPDPSPRRCAATLIVLCSVLIFRECQEKARSVVPGFLPCPDEIRAQGPANGIWHSGNTKEQHQDLQQKSQKVTAYASRQAGNGELKLKSEGKRSGKKRKAHDVAPLHGPETARLGPSEDADQERRSRREKKRLKVPDASTDAHIPPAVEQAGPARGSPMKSLQPLPPPAKLHGQQGAGKKEEEEEERTLRDWYVNSYVDAFAPDLLKARGDSGGGPAAVKLLQMAAEDVLDMFSHLERRVARLDVVKVEAGRGGRSPAGSLVTGGTRGVNNKVSKVSHHVR